jgi:nucleoside-diphosphate-sugar epimerase
MSNNTLFLVGGTGSLGSIIAKGLVTAPGFDKRVALVRSSSADDKVDYLRKLGWTIEKIHDFLNPEALIAAMSGVKVVVSTMSTGADLVPVEKNIIDAAKKCGASFFVPSQFGVDFRRWQGQFPTYESKREVVTYAEEVGLSILCVFVGLFSDIIFPFLTNLEEMTATVVGGGSARYSFTRRRDIGFVLAKVLADPKYANGGYMSMQGDCVTWLEALSLAEKAIGKEYKKTGLDTEEALIQEKLLLEKGMKGDLEAYSQSFAMHVLTTPARGITGLDVSSDAETYGVKMEPLKITLQDTFGGTSKD